MCFLREVEVVDGTFPGPLNFSTKSEKIKHKKPKKAQIRVFYELFSYKE